jgi:hypothetical protein
MSSTDIRDKNYTFEIKFGAYHQKVTITMSPFSLTMNTLREVAIRFIETMVRTYSTSSHSPMNERTRSNIVVFQCPDQDIKLLHNRILLFRYEPSSYSLIIPLNPRDILVPDTIVEVIISREFRQ